MIITQTSLEALRTGFRTNFQAGVGTAKPTHQAFTTPVSSTTKIETYGFLNDWPIFREWLGEKRVKSLEEKAYQLVNRDFEVTIGIHKNKLKDDNLGLYPSMFEGWGQEAGALKDRLAYDALRRGHLLPCFDGQNFFDTDHPVNGGVAANMGGNAAVQPWYLLDCSKSLKPLILQEREAPHFDMITDPKSDHVFKTGEYLAGGEARGAAGFTFWQLAYRCTSALTPENYEAAKAVMASWTNDEGEPLGAKPTHGVFGASNKAAARNLFKKQNLTGGESNIYFDEIEIVEADRLP